MIKNKKLNYGLLILLLFIISGFFLYYFVWQKAEIKVQKQVYLLTEILKQQGYDVSYTHCHVQGFPYHLKICFKNPLIQSKLEKFEIKTQGDFCLKSSIFSPLNILYFTQGNSFLTLNFFNKTNFNIEFNKINGKINLTNFLNRPNFLLNLQKIVLKNETIVLGKIENLDVKSYLEESLKVLRVILSIQEINVKKINQMNLFQIKSMALDSYLNFAKPWNIYKAFEDKQNKLTIKSFDLKSEKMNFKLKGIISFDNINQPKASLSIQTSDLNGVLTFLAEQNMIKKQTIYLAAIAKLFFKKIIPYKNEGEKDTIDFPLTLDHKKIYLGPIVLFTIPSTKDWLTWFEKP